MIAQKSATKQWTTKYYHVQDKSQNLIFLQAQTSIPSFLFTLWLIEYIFKLIELAIEFYADGFLYWVTSRIAIC